MRPISIESEIGFLETVLLHEPGPEIENVTPSTTDEALYDDLLFLGPAKEEHRELSRVLSLGAEVLYLRDLLASVLGDAQARRSLLQHLCDLNGASAELPTLMELESPELADKIIRGTPIQRNTFAKFLNPRPYSMPPLPNAFFMRDAAMCVHDRVIVGAMANAVRRSEALILGAIFRHHPQFNQPEFYLDGAGANDPSCTIEGGDLLILKEDLILLGYSERTSIAGIDALLASLAGRGKDCDVIIVDLPKTRSAIHLDMVFTMVDRDLCVVYPPLVTGHHRCDTYHAKIRSGALKTIESSPGILDSLTQLGLDLKPIACGGSNRFRQDREQWSSGANFFAMAPGTILGFSRNEATLESLCQAGFEVIDARAATRKDLRLEDSGRVVVSITGDELNRGGGGCRCMTLPVRRRTV